LIAAINELFKDSNHADNTFRHDSIPYPGDLQARGVAGDKLLRQDGDKPQSLRIWRYEYDDSKKPGQNKPIVDILFADVADEIVRLIMDESCRIGERSVAAKDIAVLVHTHKEAERIHAKLLERKVNAVLQNTGNVFASIEARDLALILAAMLDPSDADALRGALAGSLLPCSQQELIAFCREDDAGGAQATPATPDSVDTGRPSTLVDWMDLFKEAGARWRERALSDALAFLIRRTGMRAYLVGLPGGERRLTNLLHLLDIINATASQLRQGPSGLLSWFKRQLENDSRDGEDEHLMRLASDEDAVKIMTVFKSKGLEFPIVFVPTLWRKKAEAKGRNERTISYHDDEDMLVVTLDTKDPHAQRRAKEESLQEDVRLLYVAATRAINRVYITQLHPFLPDDYGLDWVLGGLDPGAGGHILIEDRSGERASALQLAKGAGLAGDALQTAGAAKVDKRHGHSSFSSIEPNMREMAASSARDIDSTPGSEAQTENDYARQTDIFSIPGGARTGECWHAIFEDIDFSAAESDIRAVVAEKLDRYNICSSASADIARARRESVHSMVRNTLATALPAPDGGFALKQIRMDARRSELEFNFTLRQSGINPRTTGISEVLKTHWKRDEDKQPFLAALENWDRELPLGFMTGFIDLVFCHAERFYIVDWKSNRRSGRLNDFDRAGIRDEMARHSYFLQYLIYTLALHGYLRQHLADYDYERNFGGVFYLFLRGIENEETHGIFAQRPKWELIDDLAQVLTGSGAEA
jgi:exodeoxyribonuclease V beta subunit